jgi:CRISPR-associated endoribonuclease Cas6
MLYSIVLKLKAEQDATISPTQGYYGYALFLSLLNSVAPDLAHHVHSTEEAKSVTISPLQGKFLKVTGKEVIISKGAEYWFRLSLLEDTVFANFLHSLLKGEKNREIQLESAIFSLTDVITEPNNSPWAKFDSFHSLWERSIPQRKITLQFLSPTAFRSKGRNIIFPEPELVFSSYLSKWNAYSPISFDDSLKSRIFPQLIATRYKLQSHILDFKTYKEVGFEGVCTFEIKQNVSEETLRQINALADFAFYAGTGAKTTMGMGQTRRIKLGSAP